MPAKIIIIYRLQGHIDVNPYKKTLKKFFFWMSYNKNPIEWFDI